VVEAGFRVGQPFIRFVTLNWVIVVAVVVYYMAFTEMHSTVPITGTATIAWLLFLALFYVIHRSLRQGSRTAALLCVAFPLFGFLRTLLEPWLVGVPFQRQEWQTWTELISLYIPVPRFALLGPDGYRIGSAWVVMAAFLFLAWAVFAAWSLFRGQLEDAART